MTLGTSETKTSREGGAHEALGVDVDANRSYHHNRGVATAGRSQGVDRRDFLRVAGKAGVAVGTLVWATPLVQTTVPAWAATGSGATGGPPPPGQSPVGGGRGDGGGGSPADTPPDDVAVLGSEQSRPTATSSNGAAKGALARSGIDPRGLIEVAGAAIAVGGAALTARRAIEQHAESDHEAPADREATADLDPGAIDLDVV